MKMPLARLSMSGAAFGLLLLTASAASQQVCSNIRECAQASVDAAARAETVAKAASDRISNLRIQCETRKDTGFGHYPSITAQIPADKLKTHVLTGGSCSMTHHPATPHNGTMVESRAIADRTGWYCKAGDPPGNPVSMAITAEVIFCRIEG